MVWITNTMPTIFLTLVDIAKKMAWMIVVIVWVLILLIIMMLMIGI